MKEIFKENLLSFRRKTITIDELESLSPEKQTYETFASYVLQFENENILQMIHSKGRNNRNPSLAYHYRINKHQLNRDYHKQLQSYRDRKSTRLNSSHVAISYAVFCLKKKKDTKEDT